MTAIGRSGAGPPVPAMLEPAGGAGLRLAVAVRLLGPAGPPGAPLATAGTVGDGAAPVHPPSAGSGGNGGAQGTAAGTAGGASAPSGASPAAAGAKAAGVSSTASPALAAAAAPPAGSASIATAAGPGRAAVPAGLVATVLGRQGDGGLVVELAGHRLTLLAERPRPTRPYGNARAAMGFAGEPLPPGARLAVQVLARDLPATAGLPATTAVPAGAILAAVDEAGLERLLAQIGRAGDGPTAFASPEDPAPEGPAPEGPAGALPTTAQPWRADAGLAARLLAEWRHLLQWRAEERRGPDATAEGHGRTVDTEAGRVLVADPASGWRGLFGHLVEPGQRAAPLALWQQEQGGGEGEGDGEAADGEGQRLLLTLDLSRLGRTTIDLRVDAAHLAVLVVSAEPLPAGLRRDLTEPFAAAAELAGRTGSLVFRRAGRPAAPAAAGRDRGWVG